MRRSRVFMLVTTLCMALFLCVGYAALSDTLNILGSAHVEAPGYDVYISNVSPSASSGVQISGTIGTVLSAKVTGSGTATFTVIVVNQSNKTYVFERVIDGTETGVEGVYDGTAITYSLDGLVSLQEIQPNGGVIAFTLKISVPSGVRADHYVLKFNFIEKTGTEILPGGPDDSETETDPSETDPVETDPVETDPVETDPVETDPAETDPVETDPPETDPPETEPEAPGGYHDDFLGLVEALLSDSNSCLNHDDLIFDAVMESLTSKKRPKEDAPILHCQVNSVSGGTMSAIAEYANAKLSANLHFIFEVDPDPAYQDKRMFLYMYYGSECDAAEAGEEILVYKQVVTRGDDGVWFADGTYIGRAAVGNYFGGGNSGKDVWTINPYTWKFGAPTA